MAEDIQWKPIEYFNNAIVCQLIEEKLPKVGGKGGGLAAAVPDACLHLLRAKSGGVKLVHMRT